MKVCEFCGLQSAWGKLLAYQSETALPKTKQFKPEQMPCEIRMHCLSVLTGRVHRPSATVRVAPLYRMCGRVAYLHVAFPCHSAKVCEKIVNFEWIFLDKPCYNNNALSGVCIAIKNLGQLG